MTRQEYLEKIARANEWAQAYYNKDDPLASDEEYDALMKQLRAFEEQNPAQIATNSPTQKIAPTLQSEFHKIDHAVEELREEFFHRA